MCVRPRDGFFFFFNDTATTEIYTLSLHDALPISHADARAGGKRGRDCAPRYGARHGAAHPRCAVSCRSEEHTSELQSRLHLVCRLLLEKKKNSILCRHTATCPCIKSRLIVPLHAL